MNWRIFFGTFVLIFLAELGDKTQLAAMARAATDGDAKWTVFLGASAALVTATLIAVLVGGVLTRFLPEVWIRTAAGVLFVIFGLLILWQAHARRGAPAAAPAAAEVPAGPVAAFVFRRAAEFEAASFRDYRALSARVQDPGLRGLLEELAADEEAHYARIVEFQREETVLPGMERGAHEQLPEPGAVVRDVADEDRLMLEHAIEHEEATARFYSELARLTLVPGIRHAFESLAAAESDHAARLRAFSGTVT